MVDQRLYAHLQVSGNPAGLLDAFARHATRMLRDGLPGADGSDLAFRVPVPIGARSDEGGGVLHVLTGPVESRGAGFGLPLWWQPEQEGGFSSFTGVLELDPIGDGACELSLSGRYTTVGLQLPAAEVMAATRDTVRKFLAAIATVVSPAVAGAPATVSSAALQVADLMTAQPVTVDEDTPLHVACAVLLRERVGGVPVVDRQGGVVGVLTESDLIAREAAPRRRSGVAWRYEGARRLASTAGQACTRPALTVSPDTSAREAARVLLDADVSRLMVVDDDRLLGVLSRHDILTILTRSPAELQHRVDAALAATHIPGVRAQVVSAGAVRLTGTVHRRSSTPSLERAMWSVDGVAAVHDALSWDEDDTLITP